MLATNGTSSFAFFFYAAIEWTRAQHPYNQNRAQVGFDFGDQERELHLHNYSATELLSNSNTGTDGLWAFKMSYGTSDIRPLLCHSGIGKFVLGGKMLFCGKVYCTWRLDDCLTCFVEDVLQINEAFWDLCVLLGIKLSCQQLGKN